MPYRHFKKLSLDKEKPYNVCLDCPKIGVTCDGPNFLAMTFDRWREWCTLRAGIVDMSHADIAEAGNLSKGTVDSVLSGRSTDVRRETMAAITHALTGGAWGKYPCFDPVAAQIEETNIAKALEEKDAELTRTKNALKAAEDINGKQEAFFQKEIEFRNRHIDRKNRVIFALSITIGILGAMIIGLFIADALTNTWGFFR